MAEIKIDLSGLKQFTEQVSSQLNGQTSGPVAVALKQWGFRYRSFVQERFDTYSKGGGDWPALALSTIKKRRKGPNAVEVKEDTSPTKKKSATKKKRVGIWKRVKKVLKGKKKKGVNTKRRKGKPNRFVAQRSSLARDTRHGGKLVSAGGVYSILRDTGLMFQALDPVFSGKPGAFQLQIPDGIEVGFGGPGRQPGSKLATIAEIATYHQLGGKHLPKREIIVDPPQSVIDQMAADMQRAIDKLTKQ